MKDYIDAAAFKEMILCADAALHKNIQAINDLNVFPVPDINGLKMQRFVFWVIGL